MATIAGARIQAVKEYDSSNKSFELLIFQILAVPMFFFQYDFAN